MFAPEGPTFRELAVQALSSVEHGYDLLAPKFDLTPFRTPDTVLDGSERVLERLGPFGGGLDLCCGTGAGLDVLGRLCEGPVAGVDISAGMLAAGRAAAPSERKPGEEPGPGPAPGRAPGPAPGRAPGRGPGQVHRVRADARALPFGPVFDLVVSFGAFGHFLPRELPALFAQVRGVLRPGGRFAFPLPAPARPLSAAYLSMLAFDSAMRVRNALWRPPFVMYYRTFPPARVRRDLLGAGFGLAWYPLPGLGRRADGTPRCRLVVATRTGSASV